MVASCNVCHMPVLPRSRAVWLAVGVAFLAGTVYGWVVQEGRSTTLEAAVAHYVRYLPTSACQSGTLADPINVELHDNARPTSTRTVNHVQYHTYMHQGSITEWSEQTGYGADKLGWYNSTSCVAPVSQPASLYNNIAQRFHMRVYEYPYQNTSSPDLGVVDVGQAHHEVDCGSIHIQDHLLRDYYGLDEARDQIQYDMTSYGVNPDKHISEFNTYTYWGNTMQFDAKNAQCEGPYTTESSGNVIRIRIPDSGHSGWDP